MQRDWACLGERTATSTASSRIRPPSGFSTPVRILISVDLPAPLPPISAWISPERRSKSTSMRACTPGKDFEIPCMETSAAEAAGSGIASTLLASGERSGVVDAAPLEPCPLIRRGRLAGPSAWADGPEVPRHGLVRAYVGDLLQVGVRGAEDAFLRRNPLGQFFAVGGLQGSLVHLRAELRIAFHRHAQLSGEHRLEGAARGIHRQDLHVLARDQPGFLQGLDRAQAHLVVLGEDPVDVLALAQPGFGDGLAFGDAPVAGLAVGDLDPAFAHALAESLAAVLGGR